MRKRFYSVVELEECYSVTPKTSEDYDIIDENLNDGNNLYFIDYKVETESGIYIADLKDY